jgi:hypothetical protein
MMKCLFEISDDMPINEVLETIQDLLIGRYSFDWRQAVAHPESDEAYTWGSGNVIGRAFGSQKHSKIAEFYESKDMMLAVNAVRSLPILLRHISDLQQQIAFGVKKN